MPDVSRSAAELRISEQEPQGRERRQGGDAMRTAFREAARWSDGLLVPLERRCLQWLACRLPVWVGSDHLTALALVAMAGAGASFWLARVEPLALVVVPCWLALNWFGDSLDGTVARLRNQQRPRYGFYVDHVLDMFGMLFVLAGLAASGYMHPGLAAGALIAYYLLSIDIFLAAYCLGTFRMSFWGVGPTELRVVLAIGALALVERPEVTLAGGTYRLFDVGGLVLTAGLAGTLLVSVARHTRALYRAEPLPEREVRCA